MDSRHRFELWSILSGVETDQRVTRALCVLDQMQSGAQIRHWLIKNKILGRKFRDFLEEEQFSPMRVVARINKCIVKEFTVGRMK